MLYKMHNLMMSLCRNQKLLRGILVSLRPSIRPSIHPAFRVCFVTHRVLDGFFPHQAQMITSMRGCVVYNSLWPWLISLSSFSHHFAIKLLKFGTSCRVRSTACTVLDGFFPYLAQMITSMRGRVACNDLCPMACYYGSTKPLPEPMLSCHQVDPLAFIPG